MSNTLVTGAAGFIGFHVSQRLLREGCRVVGVDNLNDYYDVALKQARLAILTEHDGFCFHQFDLTDQDTLQKLVAEEEFDSVLHFAAQTGARHSVCAPHSYGESNLTAWLNLLEACRGKPLKHLVFASSSSVYGANRKTPFSVSDPVDHPVSLYAATKRAGELIAYSYSHVHGVPITALRFFTVYGPWGRPDMAVYKFTRSILDGQPIDVYNHGQLSRDFTFIDDIVSGVLKVLGKPPRTADTENCPAPFRIYNMGSGRSVPLERLITVLEENLGVSAKRRMLPMQDGDVLETSADITELKQDVGYDMQTSIDEGIPKFLEWYREYHG